MRLRALLSSLSHLARGLRGRCPHCGLGSLFAGRFRLRDTCPYCGVRFSRARGEMLGATYINTMLTLVLALVGFFVTERLFAPPLLVQLAVWTLFCVAVPVAFFRPARGLWIAVAYLTGGVYADPDYEREWINPDRPVQTVPRPHWDRD